MHVSSLQDDFYRFDRASHTLSGHRSGNRYRLGDNVRVAVARVDVDRRELDLRMVARGKAAAPAEAHRQQERTPGKAGQIQRAHPLEG